MSKAGSGTDSAGSQNCSAKVPPGVGAPWGFTEQQEARVAGAVSRRRMST